MDKADVLDYILSHSCANPSEKHKGYHEFKFFGHCLGHIIHAKTVGNWDEEKNMAHFEIIEVEDLQPGDRGQS